MIKIRKATTSDLPILMEIFEAGKRIMRQSGNMKQWTNGYPSKELITNDIKNNNCYVCIDEKEAIIGTFAFIKGADPTYATIYQGEWLDDKMPYATIHRLASTEESHGVAEACIHWCSQQVESLRADTHRDNHILQHILTKHGFRYCGIIYLLNGDERMAYQRI